MVEDKKTTHTYDIKDSREDAERAVEVLKSQGWEIYHEKVPLSGQAGFYCVREFLTAEGDLDKEAHSIRWNQFENPLEPVELDCRSKKELFQYLLRHASHGMYVFNYSEGDLGFVCYCNAEHGWSEVLRITDDLPQDFDDETYEILWEYSNKADNEIPEL